MIPNRIQRYYSIKLLCCPPNQFHRNDSEIALTLIVTSEKKIDRNEPQLRFKVEVLNIIATMTCISQ